MMKAQDKGIKEIPNSRGVQQEPSHLGVLHKERTNKMEDQVAKDI